MTDQATNQDQRQFAIQRIYLKDVSFEAPNAPDIFRKEWQPENSLTINTTV
jgi:preprotein translocase subunit SecB